MDDNAKSEDELFSIFRGLSSKPELRCKIHAGADAFLTCSFCGYGLCRECTNTFPVDGIILCHDCKTASRKKFSPIAILKVMKYPAVWVIFCIFVAGAVYFSGFGNPSIKKYIREDAKLSWFRQRAGLIYLEKAGREEERAFSLLSYNRNDEAQKWFRFAADSFQKSSEVWKGAPVFSDLEIAKANMLMESGEPQSAIKILESLSVPGGSQQQVAVKYYLGLAYEKIHERSKSKECFLQAYTNAKSLKEKSFDKLIEQFSFGMNEAAASAKVSSICGTNISSEKLAEKCGKIEIRKRKRGGEGDEEAAVKMHEEKKAEPSDDFQIEILKDEK